MALQLQHPSNEYSGLISFRMDWLDLLAVQGTLRNLLQHHSLKASILQCSAFFIVQHSHPHMTAGKTVALTRRPFVSKVMSLLFSSLSRFLIAFLPRSKWRNFAGVGVLPRTSTRHARAPLLSFPLPLHRFLLVPSASAQSTQHSPF